MKKANECRYIVTDVASVPVIRVGGKGDAYRSATKPGWGLVEWYSAANDYAVPVNRDRSDKTQKLCCDEDSGASIYSVYGTEFAISSCLEVSFKDAPSQAETAAIISSNSCGYDFWEGEEGSVRFFVTYNVDGLIDAYRLEYGSREPCDGETEITFAELQGKDEYDNTPREEIAGTFEFYRKNKAVAS